MNNRKSRFDPAIEKSIGKLLDKQVEKHDIEEVRHAVAKWQAHKKRMSGILKRKAELEKELKSLNAALIEN